MKSNDNIRKNTKTPDFFSVCYALSVCDVSKPVLIVFFFFN